jgi:hypothetical protein
MVIEKIDIDLVKFRGNKSSVFTGRPQGYDVRKELKLDELDTSEDVIVFTIPEGTTSFNPSFYLGLLFDSYKTLGVDGFNSKYSFSIQANNPAIKRVLQKNLEDANRSAINSLNKKNPFKFFD